MPSPSHPGLPCSGMRSRYNFRGITRGPQLQMRGGEDDEEKEVRFVLTASSLLLLGTIQRTVSQQRKCLLQAQRNISLLTAWHMQAKLRL
jgi:hypothetical protein